MPRAFFSVHRMPSLPLPSRLFLIAFLCCLAAARPASAQMTLLVPNQPGIEAPTNAKEVHKKNTAEQNTVQSPAKAAPEAVQPPKPRDNAGKAEQQADGQIPATPGAAKPAGADRRNATGPVSSDAVKGEGELQTPPISEEVDVLISMMRPFRHEGLPMDMPQLFSVLRYDDSTPVKDGALQPERRDLLGDVEEIRYLDQKAWGANVALSRPGLYQFIIEARPWWDAARDRFAQHYVKTTLPVYGVERGWELPVGQRFEIQPLTRPFGLTAPALFSGRALFNGKPLDNARVRMARVNTDKQNALTHWHEELAARTDGEGRFAFVLNQPGWWCCAATAAGDPLKGQDGQPKPLELGALFWLYVDGATAEARRR
ncbi:DUF4198 domain-containing protein [uncultured Desulfovibrio sp.]|uniref:DUF4198 domain-containing protein n=1 Tax=uncultured Desulfovibrio sp. TaxID=167968 RepID=UPI0003A8A7DC|nr:DUF4198 domain-containing protein [uncultured Desulfovibrio sp.]